MLRQTRGAVRMGVTIAILIAAVFAGSIIWTHYVPGPWTRDGQVLANVVNIAPEVSGRIIKVCVVDNQTVHRGDMLYDIDSIDYQITVATAEANMNSKQADLKLKQAEAKRRADLTTLSTSWEEQQRYQSDSEVAAATLASAVAQLSQVRINLQRIPVRIHIDQVPHTVHLAAGMTATITVGPNATPASAHGLLSRVFSPGG